MSFVTELLLPSARLRAAMPESIFPSPSPVHQISQLERAVDTGRSFNRKETHEERNDFISTFSIIYVNWQGRSRPDKWQWKGQAVF